MSYQVVSPGSDNFDLLEEGRDTTPRLGFLFLARIFHKRYIHFAFQTDHLQKKNQIHTCKTKQNAHWRFRYTHVKLNRMHTGEIISSTDFFSEKHMKFLPYINVHRRHILTEQNLSVHYKQLTVIVFYKAMLRRMYLSSTRKLHQLLVYVLYMEKCLLQNSIL